MCTCTVITAMARTRTATQAAFHMGPSWAPVGPSWAPVGPQLGLTGAHLGMLLGYVLAYLMWRVLTGRHKSISLNFLITGHTKFAPDWCFGLLKQKFRKEPVSSLKEMEATVCCSTLQEVNVPQLVGDEGGTVFVPTYDWQAFLVPFSKPSNSFTTFPSLIRPKGW